MPTHATAHLPIDIARRRVFIATRFAGDLVDELEQLERDLQGPLDQDRRRGQVDDRTRLACVLHDELNALDV